ncbi:MAG: MFS transporter [Oscillospiraceae bacterium]|nr:MFS transporter [Oscillospiraceae bacterium]
MKFRLTKLEKSWILYDIANSAFILLVATLLPIYFDYLAGKANLSESDYLAYWGYAGSVATILVAVLGPICGTLADRRGYKKPLFIISMLLGVVGCAMMGVAWSWLSFLVIFVIAKVGYSSSLVFYDSMLPEISDYDKMDRVSTLGYALGYIGSVIPFVLCLAVVLGYELIGISQVTGLILSFMITAVWWLVCSLPLSRQYKQSAYQECKGNPIAETFRQLARSFREAKKHKHIFVYLLAFFFFIDGVYTIIDMATAYGKSLGLDTTGLLLALLVTQIVAFPCSIIFGRFSAKYDTGLLIKICILCYTGIAIFAVFLMVQWQFWLLAVLVGMFQGGIQALSRSYLGKIIPPEQSGEYYGLMDICGKGASFVGTTLVAVMSQVTEGMSFKLFGLPIANTGLAVGSIAVLFVIGFFLFCYADKLNKARVSV